ncbi:MAG: SET domain-containing protein-lysine N-methyltransferase [Verrucomicrobiae bacterium]|nr:SET domain-containing protein-lysine N-methyltransferase [Verrucomicrobiae bacterium]
MKKERIFTEREELWKRGSSRWCHAEGSDIHQIGVFASRDIPEDTRIIEYVGEILKNEEADQRGIDLAESVDGTDLASVFNFILDEEHQIDGNKEYNTARYINHSCDPNCWVDVIDGRIWVIALRDIAQGEELTFDYGFDVEHWKEHPCRCGSVSCVGYIVSQEQWPQLRKKIRKMLKLMDAEEKREKAEEKRKKKKDKKKQKKKKDKKRKKESKLS